MYGKIVEQHFFCLRDEMTQESFTWCRGISTHSFLNSFVKKCNSIFIHLECTCKGYTESYNSIFIIFKLTKELWCGSALHWHQYRSLKQYSRLVNVQITACWPWNTKSWTKITFKFLLYTLNLRPPLSTPPPQSSVLSTTSITCTWVSVQQVKRKITCICNPFYITWGLTSASFMNSIYVSCILFC